MELHLLNSLLKEDPQRRKYGVDVHSHFNKEFSPFLEATDAQ